MYKLAQGSTRFNISRVEFMIKSILLPCSDEQKKIAGFLGSVDEWIENLTAQKETLGSYKRGLMQRIFSQEIKFKDDEGKDFPDWEEIKLKSVGEINTGTTPKTSVNEYWGNKYLWVTPTDISFNKNIVKTERGLTEAGLEEGREISTSSLLVTCIASIGKNAILREKGSCNQQINTLTPNEENSVDFFYYLINAKPNHLLRYASSGNMKILNKTTFSKIKFAIPELKEQKKIADFLSEIDTMIANKQAEITAAKKWKRGLMQQMFV